MPYSRRSFAVPCCLWSVLFLGFHSHAQPVSLSVAATTLAIRECPRQYGVEGGVEWAPLKSAWLISGYYGCLKGEKGYQEEGYILTEKSSTVTLRVAHRIADKNKHALYAGIGGAWLRSNRAVRGVSLSWVGSSEAEGGIALATILWRWQISDLFSLQAHVDAGYLQISDSRIVRNGMQNRPLQSSFAMAGGLGVSVALFTGQ